MSLRWDNWELDIPARTVTGPDGPTHVEPQVFDVLVYLVENRDRVVSKEELLDEVWGDQFVSESALTSRIKTIRRVLGDDGRTQKYIRNVPRKGYQFVGSITGSAVLEDRATPDVADLVGVDHEFPFVGREVELSRIQSAIESRSRPLVIIAGEPGVGKTRLAVEISRRLANDGDLVTAGHCQEHFNAPLQPFREAIAGLALSSADRLLSWSQGLEGQLGYLVPNSLPILGVTAQPVDDYGAIEVLSTVIDRMGAEAGVRLIIDDLQWADEASRSLIDLLLRRMLPDRLTLLCTLRTTETDLPRHIARWSDNEVRIGRAERVELGGLDQEATTRLTTAVVGSDEPGLSQSLFARTGGHGLFLTESLRDIALGETSTASVAQLIDTRLSRLSDEVQTMVRVGAFLGNEFSFAVAALAADLDHRRGLSAVEQGMSAELLHETTDPAWFRFSHQLVPEAIRGSTTTLKAAEMHQRCAQALTQVGAPETQVALHWLQAVPLISLQEAVERSRVAARQAIAESFYENASRLLEAVLERDLDPRTRAEVLVQLGEAGNGAGRAVAYATVFEQAAELARRNGWTDILVESALGHYGKSPYRNLRNRSTEDLLQEASDALGDEVSVRRAKVLAKTAAFAQFTTPLVERDRMAREALAIAPEAAGIDLLELLEYHAIAVLCPAGVDYLFALDDQIEQLRAELGHSMADAAAPETKYFVTGQGDELRRVAVTPEFRLWAQPIAEWRDLTLKTTFAAFEGDMERAGDLAEEAGSVAGVYWGDSGAYMHILARVFLAALDEDWTQPIGLLERALAIDDNQHILAHGAWAHLAGGDGGRGAELAESILIEKVPIHAEHTLGGNTLVAIAEVARLTRNEELADAVGKELLKHTNRMLGLPWASSLAADEALSRLAAFRGDAEAAEIHRQRAIDLYTRLGAPNLVRRLAEV